MSRGPATESEMVEVAARARKSVLDVGHAAGSFGAHFGPALSLVEIMTVLYGTAIRHSSDGGLNPDRNRLVLSKGHGSLALYTVLYEYGYIDAGLLATAEQDGTLLPGQPIVNKELGIEFSSGSLGMGLSFGVGLALSARMMGGERSVYVVMGDGETNEGSVWEAAMSAAHFNLGALTAIVDVNDLQSDGATSEIMSSDHRSNWAGFGWAVAEVDGHSILELREALSQPVGSRPHCILAHTTKGKGVPFMEDVAEWHHGRLTEAQFEEASRAVGIEGERDQ